MNKNILEQLKQPFPPSAIEWRAGAISKDQTKTMALAYADVRAYQNRLDEVCNMDWSVTYTPWGERIVCHLTINGVTRSSSGEPDSQAERSEIAGTAAEAQAFKRACSTFGLGRYLYNLDTPWVEYDPQTRQISDKGKAKLNGIITQHYRRHLEEKQADLPKAEKPAIEENAQTTPAEKPSAGDDASQPDGASAAAGAATTEEIAELDELGRTLYANQWEQVRHHNIERITAGKTVLLSEHVKRLIAGMRKLQKQTADNATK